MDSGRKLSIFVAILALLAVTLCVSDAKAEDFVAVPLAEGEAAPFAGQLLSTELALKLGLKAERCDTMNRLAIEYERKSHAIKSKLAEDLLVSAEHRCQLELKAIGRAMPAFYERPWFVMMATSTVWVVVFFGAATLLGNLSR